SARFAGAAFPPVLLSGRVSPRSFRRYLWGSPLLAARAQRRDAVRHADRGRGGAHSRARVTGSLKLETVVEPRVLTIENLGPLWIAASTHAGEEDVCARVFARLQ